jgi:hypothetical protein
VFVSDFNIRISEFRYHIETLTREAEDASAKGILPADGSVKNVTILSLPWVQSVLHLVCPHGQPRYYLLLTGIHRLLAPLFTSIRILLRTLTLHHRHDPTKTRNSARFA